MLELFSATKKKEVVKLCKKMTLADSDLVSMINGCGAAGYCHIPRFFDTDSNHLWEKAKRERTPDNMRAMFNQLEKESKRIAFHFFARNDNLKVWHLFFYDTTEFSGRSRFSEGSHLHFVNHLWGLDVNQVFDNLPERPTSSVHIKVRSEQDGGEQRASGA